MGGRPGDLRRDDYTVERATDLAEAAALIRHHHYSRSTPNTATYCHLLYPRDGWPWVHPQGAAWWMPPIRAAAQAVAGQGWEGVLVLSRLACTPEAPRNAASHLLAASMRLIDRDRWPVLLTYADTRMGHTGAIYLATGWTSQGPVPAGDVWVNAAGEQRGRKRGGRTLHAHQMRELGFQRLPPAPKIRYIHTKAAS